jgi:arginine repressor
MTIRTAIVAAVLALSPLAAAAQCSDSYIDTTAMSCVQGTVWDADTRTCVPQTNS